jgi:hypothetical protein
MTKQSTPVYRYHRDVPAPETSDHPNAMACPKCGVPVWQSAPECHGCRFVLNALVI